MVKLSIVLILLSFHCTSGVRAQYDPDSVVFSFNDDFYLNVEYIEANEQDLDLLEISCQFKVRDLVIETVCICIYNYWSRRTRVALCSTSI